MTFFDDAKTLANKFEPFNNFAAEQASFELNNCTMDDRKRNLIHSLDSLQIKHDEFSAVKTPNTSTPAY